MLPPLAETVYGDTPPVVLAVEPDLLDDCAALQRITYAVERQLRRCPAWLCVAAPSHLVMEADGAAGPTEDLWQDLEALRPTPYPDRPAGPDGALAPWLEQRLAEVVQEHLTCQGMTLPVRIPADVDRVPRAAAIVPARLVGAAPDATVPAMDGVVATARMLGARDILAWRRPRSAWGRVHRSRYAAILHAHGIKMRSVTMDPDALRGTVA